MPPSKAQKPVTLFYGNQAYSVEQGARALTDQVLGDGPRDFSLHRFDAEDLLRGSGADGDSIDAFQLACETQPFLCEQYVVRLDHLEAVRVTDRSAQALQRQIAELRLFPCRWEGENAWALEEELLPEERGGTPAPLQRWVREVESRPGTPPRLHLAEGEEGARFLVVQGRERSLLTLRPFLQSRLKGRFAFADESEEVGAAAPAASASGRLHQVLERLIERPPPGLYLVLTAAASRESDLSRPLLASIRNHGSVEKSVTYDDYEPVEWVLKESRARGVNLDRPGAELFIHLAGNNLGRLAAELDKLSLLHGQGPPPDEAALVRAVHGSQRASLFLITDRLGVRDLAGALGVLEHFLADTPGEHPVLIGILSRFFRQLLHLQSLRQQGVSEADWASRLKLPPFIVRKLAAQARRFAPGELEAILRALAGLELTLRRHAHLTGPLFREFLHAVCREGFDPSGKAGPFLGSGLAGRA